MRPLLSKVRMCKPTRLLLLADGLEFAVSDLNLL